MKYSRLKKQKYPFNGEEVPFYDYVRNLYRIGMLDSEIAAEFGLSRQAWYKHLEQDKKLMQAKRLGLSMLQKRLLVKVLQSIEQNDDVKSAIWLLKVKFREFQDLEVQRATIQEEGRKIMVEFVRGKHEEEELEGNKDGD